jgi:hypothetical protein
MNRTILFSIIIMLCAMTSCSKKEANITPEPQLFGKWQAVEQYNSYLNGGDFQWHTIQAGALLEFKRNGDYIKMELSNAPCTGKFAWQQLDKSIELNISCQVNKMIQKYSELNDNTLILDYQGREGIIRYKYKRI